MQISRWSTLLLGFSINTKAFSETFFFLDFDSEALFLSFLSSTTKSLTALFTFADFLTRSCAFGLSRSSIFFAFVWMVLHILQIDCIFCCCTYYLFRDQCFHILVVLLEVVDWVLPKLRMGLHVKVW